jgi:histone H3/H4
LIDNYITLVTREKEILMETYWRKCGSCKKDIGFNQVYQECSVCGSKYAFCSVDCWDQHVPVMNHKNAWAEENRSPMKSEATHDQPVRRIVVSTSSSAKESPAETEILIVASKLKQYVKDKYDMNTSANVMEALSREVRRLTDRAVEKAKAEGRKTLMDRDF